VFELLEVKKNNYWKACSNYLTRILRTRAMWSSGMWPEQLQPAGLRLWPLIVAQGKGTASAIAAGPLLSCVTWALLKLLVEANAKAQSIWGQSSKTWSLQTGGLTDRPTCMVLLPAACCDGAMKWSASAASWVKKWSGQQVVIFWQAAANCHQRRWMTCAQNFNFAPVFLPKWVFYS